MSNKIECFVANIGGNVYVVPNNLRERFDIDPEERFFEKYILPEDGIMDDVLVDKHDLENLLDGWY